MARVVVVGGHPRSLVMFRGQLIRELSRRGHTVMAMSAPADAATVSELSALGATFHPYPVARAGLNPIEDLRTFLSLRRTFKALQPDVVLAYTIKPAVWGGMAVRRPTRFFALITGLGYAFRGHGMTAQALRRLTTWLYRVALLKAERVIFQNRDDRATFETARIVRGTKCEVVPGSGIDLTEFRVIPLSDGPPRFLMVARLLEAKGVREFARAAAIVKPHNPDAVFMLVGPEDTSPDAISLDEVAGWVASGTIEYHGEHRDVRPFYADSHIYVLPSHHEGMPRTVLEAMATGRPILTTDVPGCRETVESGVNGFLVPRGSAELLADRMLWLINHRSAWPAMALASRRRAEMVFDVRAVNKQLLNIMSLDGAPQR